jgi:hypothetical protein
VQSARRFGVRLPFLVSLLGVAVLAGCDGAESDNRSDPAVPSTAVSRFELVSLPDQIARECREIASLASGPILCPSAVPRPDEDARSSPLVKWINRGSGPSKPVVGLFLVYEPEAELGVANELIHFTFESTTRRGEFVGYGAERDAARETSVAGKHGVWVPPTGRDPARNHGVFVWREKGRKFAVSVHDVGVDTRALLAALLGALEDPEQI